MIKKTIITSLLIASSAIAFANSSVPSNTSSANSSDRVMAGYLDITAMGSADSVDLSQVAKDGYNEAVISFATVDANNNISFKDDYEALAAKKIQQAKDAGLKVLISVGGENNTYTPNGTDAKGLAQNIVNFLNKYGLDGIDFDIEIVETATNNGTYLRDVITNIKDIDSSKLVVIAPQINNDKLVSTGNDEFYAPLFSQANKILNLVDYVFVQNYNTTPEQNPKFVQDAFKITTDYIGSKTAKVVIGYPTAAQAAGAATVYFPHFDDDYNNPPAKSSALTTYDAMKSVYDNLGNIPEDTKFAGFMGWSLNVDYVPEAYNTGSVKYPAHGVGDFGYYMSPCALDSSKCAKIPDEKETPKTATILVHNNSPKYGFDGGITFTSSNGSINTPGYVSPTGGAASATSPIGTSITVAPKITWYAKPLSCPNKMDTTKYSRAEIYVADNPSAPGTLAINCDFGN
ncbi:glycoside hydrolase family 18 protein [Francisella philomiragia]|uniref:chitinase n=1 Tax=Francisella philomiragia TaxID=28110 RepID=A0A0B6CPG3_9GAMM|nr:glycoside hydrolase family 18 protein [Francisella philomiragia]AJI52374.1 glycosyl hydrolases 18 family protein [Francisella philomiragia]